MPRGKNYVNNNKGMALQAPGGKKKEMTECFYGAGCTRSDCIYKHPPRQNSESSIQQSKEPCMAFLAGKCVFTGKGCRKRHPPKQEADRLREKYSKIKCRFGEKCRTNGCLYLHPGDETLEKQEPVAFVSPFPPQQQVASTSYISPNVTPGVHQQHQPQQYYYPPQQHLYYQQQQYYYQQQQMQQQALYYQQAQQRRQHQQQGVQHTETAAGPAIDPDEFPSLEETASK